ncbi:MAG: DNA polymerase I [Alphaproteobacteria bacterium]|nr:DNA polymerase I [Alphaproteobacteria bacterium]
MTQEAFFIVDGSSFIFRAFYSLPPLTRPDGTPVGAVLGFTNMLVRLLNEMHAHKLVVVFDAGRKTFRNDLYPEYKANRGETPEDLIPQFPIIRDACEAFDIPFIEKEGFEADDLIATYTVKAKARGLKTIIVSSDKDLMQLVDDQVQLYDSMKDTFINRDRVIEKFGVPPEKVQYILALAGDSSDNIPGVPGIGPKTAAELIQTYGDLETLLSSTDSIKQVKRRELLETHKDQARLSLKLVRLKEDVFVDQALDDFILHQPNPEKVLAFLRHQGFKSLESKFSSRVEEGALNLWAKAPEKKPQTSAISSYETITTETQLKQWIDLIQSQRVVCVDTETDSLSAMDANLVGIALAVPSGQAGYIPLQHKAPEATLLDGPQEKFQQLPIAMVLERLKPLFEDPSILKIGHNIKYDKLVLKKYDLPLTPFDDTMLLSYLLESGRHGLDHLAEKHFQHPMISFKDVVGSGQKAKTFDQINLKEATNYAAEDAEYTLKLHHLLKPQVVHERLLTIYETIDRPLVDPLVEMENHGVKIDAVLLKNLSHDLSQKIRELEEKIYEMTGQVFNIGSPKQLGEVLFDHMKIPSGGKSKTGAYSTDSDVLEKIAEEHPVAQKILEWRQLSKLKNTYTDSLPQQICRRTGRVHTSYAMAVTSTGRLSSSDPNLQNIPIRTPIGRRIREAFVAEAGSKLISIDYSQIELRLLAHYADIHELKAAFQEGIDIHALTASQVFGIPLDQMTSETRSRAKAINFGIIYGISAFGLSNQLGISRADAAQYIEAYHKQYPGIKQYMTDQIAFAQRHGYVTTLLGRRCYVPNIGSKNPSLRGFAERQAINAPLQGSNADIIKKAMIKIPGALKKENLQTKMLLQVHDELVFESLEQEVDQSISILKPLMETIISLSVPLRVDAGIGKSWAEAHA